MDRLAKLEEGMVRFEAMLQAVTSSGTSDQPSTGNMLPLLKGLFDLFKDQVSGELADIRTQLTSQGNYLDRLETYTRRNCVLVHGIPESDAKTEPECMRAVTSIFSTKLDVPIAVTQLDRAHRLGPVRTSQNAKPRPVIVKFLAYNDKRLVYAAKKKLKAQPLLITESLTKARVDVYKRACTHFTKEKVWTNDGKICIKLDTKIFTVATIKELEDVIVRDSSPRNTINTRRGTS